MRPRGALPFVLAVAACEPVDVPVGAWSASEGLYLEAEAGELSADFAVALDASASSGAYLAPPELATSDAEPGAARARYAFELGSAGEYAIWGRIRSPDAASNRFWLQVDGGTWYKWRISVGDVWYWDAVHDDAQYGTPLVFSLTAGPHELVLANCVPGAALDRWYVTAQGDTPPGNTTACSPPHSIERAGECLPSCGSLSGTQCGAAACEGKILLSAYDCDVCCREP